MSPDTKRTFLTQENGRQNCPDGRSRGCQKEFSGLPERTRAPVGDQARYRRAAGDHRPWCQVSGRQTRDVVEACSARIVELRTGGMKHTEIAVALERSRQLSRTRCGPISAAAAGTWEGPHQMRAVRHAGDAAGPFSLGRRAVRARPPRSPAGQRSWDARRRSGRARPGRGRAGRGRPSALRRP
jgi:hypothetical protein